MKDPGPWHRSTIQIDDNDPITIDTKATSRATGQMIFASDDLEDGDQNIDPDRGQHRRHSTGLEAAYVINNGGQGMIGLEQDSYTMNEESTLDVKIVRVGGSTGTITALLQPNPGTAIQDDFDTEQITEDRPWTRRPDGVYRAGDHPPQYQRDGRQTVLDRTGRSKRRLDPRIQ